MGVGEVVVDAHHTVILAGVAFIRGDQFTGPIAIVRAVRRRDQIEKRLYQGIDRDGGTSAGSSAAASRRISSGGQQSLVGKGVGHRGYCSGRLYLPKSLVVDKEEGTIMLQWPSGSSAELIADEWWDRIGGQIEIVLGIERRIPMQFPERSVKLVTAGLGCHVDDGAAMPAVLRVEGLGQNADLC